MSFYLYAREHGGKIFHRYIDEAGNEQSEVLENVDLYLGRKSARNTGYKSIFGDNVEPIHFSNVREFKQFYAKNREEKDLFGMQRPIVQFLHSRYSHIDRITPDMSRVRILNFDIETSCAPGQQFPDPLNPIVEIISISFKIFGNDQRVTLGFKPYKKQKETDLYIQCESEKDLLIKSIKYIRKVNPHVLTGWNIDIFDIPYMVERIRRVLGDDYVNALSQFNDQWNPVSEYNGIYHILGMHIIDYLVIYRKYQMDMLPSYRLDYVGNYEGVGGKVEYMEKWGSLHNFYINDFQEFIRYNERDVEVVENIDGKRGYIELLMLITYMNMVPMDDFLFATRTWDAGIYHKLWANHTFIPFPRIRSTNSEGAEGAYVFDPRTGMVRWVASIDANSLYPTNIEMFNVSPETLVDKSQANFNNYIVMSSTIVSTDVRYRDIFDSWLAGKRVEEEALPQSEVNALISPIDPDYITAGNGVKYRKDVKGIIPSMVSTAVADRKIHNNERKRLEAIIETMDQIAVPEQFEKTQTQIKIENAIQSSLKIHANSVYGACLEQGFRYYQKEIGESITSTGRFVLFSTRGHVNKLFNGILGTTDVDYIVYGDTDSLYIHLEPMMNAFYKGSDDDIDAKINWIDDFMDNVLTIYLARVFQVIQRYTNTNESLLRFKREAIIDVGIWVAKKRYIVRVWDNEGVRYSEPHIKHTGVETVRSTTPQWWKNQIHELVDVFFNKGENECVSLFRGLRNKFIDSGFNEWASQCGVNGVEKYRHKTSGAAHIMGAVTFNRYLEKHGLTHIEPIADKNKIKWIYLNKAGQHKYGHTTLAYPNDDILKDIGLTIDYVDVDKMYEKGSKALYKLAEITGWPTSKLDQIQSLDIMF